MTFEMSDHVPGLNTEQVDQMVDEAEAGHDLDAHDVEPNPHLLVVPFEFRDAIAERAQLDGESPDNVVRQALAAYLNPA